MENFTLKQLYKFYDKIILEKYPKEDIRIVESIISEKEGKLFENTSATGGPAGAAGSSSIGVGGGSVGMGSVVPTQASAFPGALNGTDWINGGGSSGSGDISVPYNPSGKNRVFQKIPVMGKSHGAQTGKKSRVKPLDIKALRNAFSKNKKSDTSMGKSEKPKKVMNFDDFAKGNINKITRVKEGKTYSVSKSPVDIKIDKDGFNLTDRISTFQNKIESHVVSQGANLRQVGNDFEILYGDVTIAQVMFRANYIGIKKNGSKFTDEYKYTELGNIKSNLTKIVKDSKYK